MKHSVPQNVLLSRRIDSMLRMEKTKNASKERAREKRKSTLLFEKKTFLECVARGDILDLLSQPQTE